MSQQGAEAMATQGRQFDEILAYYYPGTVIDKLSDVEYNRGNCYCSAQYAELKIDN